MKSRSIQFSTNCDRPQQRRDRIREWLQECRQGTLAIFAQVDEAAFCAQAHPDFSPVGWHFGHIAYTESLWLRERNVGLAPLFPEHRRLFMADGLPKCDRVKLPNKAVIHHYLDTVRQEVLQVLETIDIDRHERLWRWMLQHESQHCETIAFLLQLSVISDQLPTTNSQFTIHNSQLTHHSPLTTHYYAANVVEETSTPAASLLTIKNGTKNSSNWFSPWRDQRTSLSLVCRTTAIS